MQYVCPILILLQLISFLDRGNIGYAATQGMITDIDLVGTQLNTAISLFYPLYILAEFPAALVVKRLGFNRVIPAAAMAWGIVCLSNGFVQNFAGLAVCRMLLGMFEVSRTAMAMILSSTALDLEKKLMLGV
jgi:sugar phosphate permease